jgi:predicted RNA-binding protein with PUA-like domain
MGRFWLFKSEPETFSIHDLASARGRRTTWEGVRNYQARNFLRDDVRRGDGVLFYHSSTEPMVVAGTAEVIKAGYPDHFAWEPGHPYFDAASTPDKPVWYMVDIKLVEIFRSPVTRAMLQAEPACRNMLLLKKGSRLSIQPVTPEEWEAVLRLAASATANS